MCYNNLGVRTNAEAEAILTLATETAEAKLRAGEPFTALDISNALKARNFPVRHREISAVVRGLYIAGGMASYGYDRELISVDAESGDRTLAYLYRHSTQSARDYTNTALRPLPLLSIGSARALDDSVPAGVPLTSMAKAALTGMVGNSVVKGNGATIWGNRPARAVRISGGPRRDGAIAVPRPLIAQAGWHVGDTLELVHEPSTGSLILKPAAGNVTGVLVRVWADLRVRIAKTKVRLSAMAQVLASGHKPNFAMDAFGVRIRS